MYTYTGFSGESYCSQRSCAITSSVTLGTRGMPTYTMRESSSIDGRSGGACEAAPNPPPAATPPPPTIAVAVRPAMLVSAR